MRGRNGFDVLFEDYDSTLRTRWPHYQTRQQIIGKNKVSDLFAAVAEKFEAAPARELALA